MVFHISRVRAWAGLLLAIGVVAAATIAPAGANFGSSGSSGTSGTTNGVWLTNNNNFVVGKRVLTSTYATGVNNTINNDYDNISGFTANAYTASSCSDASYDACVYDGNYQDNGFNGWNQCAGSTSGSHPNRQCSVTYVKINEYYSPPATRIACHELGHSVGLRHKNVTASCLMQTSEGGTSSVLNYDDRDHLILEY